MEIQDLRAIFIPDMESAHGPSTYSVIKSRDGLYWEPDISNLPDGVDMSCASFDLPFIDERWLITESVQEVDSENKPIFEMDIIEVEGYYQKYFIVVRLGYTFVLFDGSNSVLSDPQGEVWGKCKVVCPIWESSNIKDFDVNAHKIINLKL